MVIDQLPKNAFEAFCILRQLPRDIEFAALVTFDDLKSKEIGRTLEYLVKIGWDLALTYNFGTGHLDTGELHQALLETRDDVKQIARYDCQYFAVEEFSSIEYGIAKAINEAGLEPFSYERVTMLHPKGSHYLWPRPRALPDLRSRRMPIIGGSVSHKKEAESLKGYLNILKAHGSRIVGIDCCIHGESVADFPEKKIPALLILDGQPSCPFLRQHIMELIQKGELGLGVGVNMHDCSSAKRFGRLSWSMDASLIPVYMIEGPSSITSDMRLREVQLAAAHIKRYGHGSVLRYVLTEDTSSMRMASKMKSSSTTLIAPHLVFTSDDHPKRVLYNLRNMRAGSVILMKVRQNKYRRQSYAIIKTLNLIVNFCDTTKYNR